MRKCPANVNYFSGVQLSRGEICAEHRCQKSKLGLRLTQFFSVLKMSCDKPITVFEKNRQKLAEKQLYGMITDQISLHTFGSLDY